MLTRRHLASAPALLAAPAFAQGNQRVRMLLDWTYQSPNAFALVARERGFFREAGVEVQVDRGQGSGAVPVGLAGGTHDIGYGDISAAIRFAAENPDKGLICVALLHDRAPLCAIVRADGPIRTPKDLEGKRLAAPDFDAGRQLFPAFARAAGIDASKVTFVSVSPALREPMLVRREADGITGFVTTSALALKGIGLDHPAQRVFLYSDHGLNLYGGCLLTTRAFAERNPAALRGALAGLIRGFRVSVNEPEAMLAVLRQAEPLVDIAQERERQQMNIRLIATDHVRQQGISVVDPARMQAGIEAVQTTFNLSNRLAPAAFYTDAFLPPVAERRL
ncbi:taurine ABC transporter permease [Rhodovarius crocodyli]|uniref:Thiamine pyrimidine synthase n=1 Tax=Rhodovarius crocodyli TaxID=1979269 RepID=A0A437LWF5_9PROT|nr:ABC transporter substrate-binding protein [Rhodovarius crocodyli]RVT89657.1 taurine ABC transporter permease [Rhodovarius crocodyli]